MPGEMILTIWDVERRVLTTRRDGWIRFNVNDRGDFTIYTECYG